MCSFFRRSCYQRDMARKDLCGNPSWFYPTCAPLGASKVSPFCLFDSNSQQNASDLGLDKVLISVISRPFAHCEKEHLLILLGQQHCWNFESGILKPNIENAMFEKIGSFLLENQCILEWAIISSHVRKFLLKLILARNPFPSLSHLPPIPSFCSSTFGVWP